MTISSNIEVGNLICTGVETVLNSGSAILKSGLGLGLELGVKSLPFILDRTLDLIVNPVILPNDTPFITPFVGDLSQSFTELSRLNSELSIMLARFFELTGGQLLDLSALSTQQLTELLEVTQAITNLKSEIANFIGQISSLLELCGGNLSSLPTPAIPYYTTFTVPGVPVIEAITFDFTNLNISDILASVTSAFNQLKA